MKTHMETNTRLYKIWTGIKSRCLNPNASTYYKYGGRGISICDEWKESYESFRDWAKSNGYQDDLSIERIDVNGNYEPSNCKWITFKEQAYNQRRSHLETMNGETHCIAEWAKILGIDSTVLYQRMHQGYTFQEAISKPITPKPIPTTYTYRGETHTISEWSKITGLNEIVLWHRLKERTDTYTIEQALTEPVNFRRKHPSMIEYQGETKSIKEWAKCLGVSYSCLYSRLFYRGWTVEEAFTYDSEAPVKNDCP